MANILLDIGVLSSTVALCNLPDKLNGFPYHKWCQESGSDIIHLDIASTSIVILDMHNWPGIYWKKDLRNPLQNRIRMPIINGSTGRNFHLVWMPYDEVIWESIHPKNLDIVKF
ncbi:hypothetical protein H2248_012073 [Termitomyces sp. 'cryptogamus']|nr:hypothetical protein H2248_012073 [Termitomyces sp. 'cryptogamus']